MQRKKRNYFPSRRRVKHTSRPVPVPSTAEWIIAIRNILQYVASDVFVFARIVVHICEADCSRYGRIDSIFSHSLHFLSPKYRSNFLFGFSGCFLISPCPGICFSYICSHTHALHFGVHGSVASDSSLLVGKRGHTLAQPLSKSQLHMCVVHIKLHKTREMQRKREWTINAFFLLNYFYLFVRCDFEAYDRDCVIYIHGRWWATCTQQWNWYVHSMRWGGGLRLYLSVFLAVSRISNFVFFFVNKAAVSDFLSHFKWQV